MCIILLLAYISNVKHCCFQLTVLLFAFSRVNNKRSWISNFTMDYSSF
jgi:hypothetical protein